MEKYIFTGFSPNTRAEDVSLACKLIFLWQWQLVTSQSVKKLEQWFREYYGVSDAYAVDSGRSALQIALAAGGIGPGNEVLVQAFTCMVVSNAVTNLGAVPVYVDCASNYNIDPNLIEAAITPQTKAIIIQHTFGAPADVEKIRQLARKHNLLILEDCAHALGGTKNGQLLGTFGDLAIFSFGSDKVISGVRGGMIITDNPVLGAKLKKIQVQLPRFPVFREWQHLLHPIIFYWGKKTYHLGIGKIKLYLAKKLHLINRIIDQSEKQGGASKYFPATLPSSLATLALNQIKHLDTWNKQRQENVEFYLENLKNKKSIQILGDRGMWLRFPVQVLNPQELKNKARARQIILGDWYVTPIAPIDASAKAANYRPGSCPEAEKLGQGIINLPTDPSLTKADLNRIIDLF